jgi:DNA invertase Pin-like site-specific DNA recombinase
VEFIDQPMSQSHHDQLLVQIRGAVAEYERSLIAERMRRGRMQKYQAGSLLPWTRPPYGSPIPHVRVIQAEFVWNQQRQPSSRKSLRATAKKGRV